MKRTPVPTNFATSSRLPKPVPAFQSLSIKPIRQDVDEDFQDQVEGGPPRPRGGDLRERGARPPQGDRDAAGEAAAGDGGAGAGREEGARVRAAHARDGGEELV